MQPRSCCCHDAAVLADVTGGLHSGRCKPDGCCMTVQAAAADAQLQLQSRCWSAPTTLPCAAASDSEVQRTVHGHVLMTPMASGASGGVRWYAEDDVLTKAQLWPCKQL